MRMIRPKTIDGTVLTSSNIAETAPAAWDVGTTYAEGDQVAVPLARIVSNHANVTVTDLGDGEYRATKTSGDADWIGDAISAHSLPSDFTVRARISAFSTGLTSFVGINIDPLTGHDYTTIDRALQLGGDGIIRYWENGANLGTGPSYTASDYLFIQRVGAVVKAYQGTSPNIALATLIYTFTNLSGAVYYDSSFQSIGTTQDVLISYTASVSTVPVLAYRSLQASNLNNDPIATPSHWAPNGYVYPAWTNITIYAAGDRIADAVAHRLYESLSGGTGATVTTSIASPCIVAWNAHGLAANAPVVFQTTGALPTGLTVGTVYYVLSPSTNSFNVSATPGGAAIGTSGAQSGVHTAIGNPNLSKPVSDQAFWLDIGPSNKWAMFDTLNGTVTTDATTIDVTLAVPGRADSIALLNVANAASLRVIMTDAVAGVVYDETVEMTSTVGIDSWFDWFFEEVVQRNAKALWDLPVYSNPTIRVILAGINVQCGVMVVGLQKSLGDTIYDSPPKFSITDYSRAETDEFGNVSIAKRAFSKKASFQTALTTGEVDAVQKVLEQYRSTPAVWEGTDQYESALIFGFYGGFESEVRSATVSYLTIDIKGLT